MTFAQNALRTGASVQMCLFERISARQGTPKEWVRRKKKAPREKKLAYQRGGRISPGPGRKQIGGEGPARAVPGSLVGIGGLRGHSLAGRCAQRPLRRGGLGRLTAKFPGGASGGEDQDGAARGLGGHAARAVLELEGLAGEPMDVLVNGTLIAQGEVVVVNDKFGIRLTDIITPAERIRKLRS